MLEVFAKILGPTLLSVCGFYVIKVITKSDAKLLRLKNIVLIIFLLLVNIFLHDVKYTGVESFIIFLINIVIYKYIFANSIEESIVVTAVMMVGVFLSDIIIITLMKLFWSVDTIRSSANLSTLATILVCALQVIIINIRVLRTQLNKFYKYCQSKSSLMSIAFFIILIIGLCLLAYNSAIYSSLNVKELLNIFLIIILGVLAYIFIKSRNSYNELTDKYDSLFIYVQNFEDWIEKEQLNRHEYKNQLAVLRCLTKEKKVKEKIDEILEDNINIGGEVINQLKQLPKGGIKGLLYYKVAIAQKKKVKVVADISLETKSILKHLSEKEIRTICNLLGIYLDNAIEAAAETRKKNLLIEVYELSDKVCFVISNTFKKCSNFDDRNKKGITTKGEGRGNGLYFASKLIAGNKNLESKQDVIDNYYIQQLIINKKNTKKKN